MRAVDTWQRAGSAWQSALSAGRSAPAGVLLLVAGNLVPLVGVLALGWSVAAILFIYWVENGIVGALNVVRMLLAEAPEPAPRSRRLRKLPDKLSQVLLFVVHYGAFWIAHGVLIAVLAGLTAGPFDLDMFAPFAAVASDPAILASGLALLVGHAYSLLADYIGRGEYRRVSPARQSFWPYPRLITLHLTVTFGGVLLLGGPPVALVGLLVAFKTLVDLTLFLLGRQSAMRRLAGSASSR